MCILHHKARYNLHITFLMRPLYPKCHSVFYCHLFCFDLTHQISYRSHLVWEGTGDADGSWVFVWTCVRWRDEHGSACELLGPWLAPGLGSRRLLLQILPLLLITYQTLILFKSIITEQNWVPVPCVYFLIRCLDNRRPRFEFTRTECPSGWPALVMRL